MEFVAYEELLEKEGRIITHVVGTSMLPLLYNRESIVIVEAADRVPPGQGDVVLYKTGDKYLLHRIMRVKPNEYLIRGDNTWVLESVPKGALLATMTDFYRHPDSRLISRKNPVYRLYILMLPCVRYTRCVKRKVKSVLRKVLRCLRLPRSDG